MKHMGLVSRRKKCSDFYIVYSLLYYSQGFIIKNHISPAKKKYVEVEGISKGTPAYNLNFPRLGEIFEILLAC